MKLITYATTLTGTSGTNGDAFYISPDKKLFLLADGASGAGKEGKVLMSKTCIEIAREFDYGTSGLEPREYVDQLFWRINNRLLKLSQEYKKLVFGTIDIAVYDNGVLTVTTLGDSPMFLSDGVSIKRLVRSPKKYEWMIDKGYITPEQYQGYIESLHPIM